MTRVARIIRKHNWPSWTIKEVKDCMLWYALHNGYIHVRGSGDSILLARKLISLDDRIKHDHCEDGRILWIEFFYYDDPVCAVHLLLLAIDRYKESVDWLAYHQGEDPLSCKIYAPRFVLKLINHLWEAPPSLKFLPSNQPRQRLSLS